MKNYINFVNDHSGSMAHLASAACQDFNTNISAIKKAASEEMLDTVVSVAELGYNSRLSVTVSNPHVLKPKISWAANGGTPLWTTTRHLIEMLLRLPDIANPDVSVLVMMTTDGEATDGGEAHRLLQQAMRPLLSTGRWTFVARVPKSMTRGQRQDLLELGIPEGNIQTWDTTAAGMAASTVQTTQAMTSYFRGRTAGVKSSSSFYADASKVNLAVLEDISKKVSLYVVPQADNGIEIRPFVLRHRMEYLKGAAFYQLSKTESKVAHNKMILVREQTTGKVYAGKEARDMIGLPSDRGARLHPGNHANYDIFIQSFSVNRKLVAGSGVIYWKEIGVPFTEADLAYLQPKAPAAAPAVPQLLTVPVSTTPTKSPIPVTPRFEFFETREEARRFCGANGIKQSDILNNPTGPKGKRWSVPTALIKQPATAIC